jgi:hypothetical protein
VQRVARCLVLSSELHIYIIFTLYLHYIFYIFYIYIAVHLRNEHGYWCAFITCVRRIAVGWWMW